MKVAKFGGSSLASAAQIKQACAVVAADPARRLIVVSAPGKRSSEDIKVTDLLIATAEARLANRPGTDELGRVIERFALIAADLGLAADSTAPIEADLRQRLDLDTADAGLFTDTLKAAGEDNCARLVALYLCHLGLDADYIDPRQAGMLLSDEPGNARVLQPAYGRLRALRQRQSIGVFPGFFGYTEAGRLVTFPRGGSDITGAILAAAVEAEAYENFTDVDSVYAANPKLVEKPQAVAEITYREMRELAYAGFSVFHDEALEPVFHAGIPVVIKNTGNPQAPGTRIVPQRQSGGQPVTGIAATDGFCSVYVGKYLMNRQIGFGRLLLEILEDEAIPFEHAPTGIDNMSVILREANFPAAAEERVLRRIRTELQADEVTVKRGQALVMVVGEGMHHIVGMAARATTAFASAGVNLEMINQGSSEVSMMFGIEAGAIPDAVQSLYHEFFGGA
jgi:aspartate kinase